VTTDTGQVFYRLLTSAPCPKKCTILPETTPAHQIRVHLWFMEHSVLTVYGELMLCFRESRTATGLVRVVACGNRQRGHALHVSGLDIVIWLNKIKKTRRALRIFEVYCRKCWSKCVCCYGNILSQVNLILSRSSSRLEQCKFAALNRNNKWTSNHLKDFSSFLLNFLWYHYFCLPWWPWRSFK